MISLSIPLGLEFWWNANNYWQHGLNCYPSPYCISISSFDTNTYSKTLFILLNVSVQDAYNKQILFVNFKEYCSCSSFDVSLTTKRHPSLSLNYPLEASSYFTSSYFIVSLMFNVSGSYLSWNCWMQNWTTDDKVIKKRTIQSLSLKIISLVCSRSIHYSHFHPWCHNRSKS